MNRNAYTPITADPVLLRLNSCRDWGTLHQRIRKAFGFPDYYGENWDAMWDCLTDVFLQPVQKAAAHMVKHKGQYQASRKTPNHHRQTPRRTQYHNQRARM